MPVTVKLGGLSDFKQDLEAVRQDFEKEALTLAITAGRLALAVARAGTPVETGRTRDGWFLNVIGRGSHRGRGRYLVVLDHLFNRRGKWPRSNGQFSLLDVLEFGSRAHVITPKSTRMSRLTLSRGVLSKARRQGPALLRFQIGGRWIVTDRVVHPGTKPYAMLRKAAVIGQRAFEDLAADAITRILARRRER